MQIIELLYYTLSDERPDLFHDFRENCAYENAYNAFCTKGTHEEQLKAEDLFMSSHASATRRGFIAGMKTMLALLMENGGTV